MSVGGADGAMVLQVKGMGVAKAEISSGMRVWQQGGWGLRSVPLCGLCGAWLLVEGGCVEWGSVVCAGRLGGEGVVRFAGWLELLRCADLDACRLPALVL